MTNTPGQQATPDLGVAGKRPKAKPPKRDLPTHLKALERWANLVWAIGVLTIIGGLIAGVAIGGQTERTSRYGNEELTHLAEGVGVAATGVVTGLLLGLAGNFAIAWVAEREAEARKR